MKMENEKLKFYAEWGYRIILAILVAATLYLKNNYASHEEVGLVGERVVKIETALAVLVEQNKVNDRQDRQLEDHESRIRDMERRAK